MDAAAEADSRFLLQMDERLVAVNDGDEGIIYIFEDAIEMQCH